MPCDTCRGKRFNPETLAVTYKGRTMADVLAFTFEEAGGTFSRPCPPSAGPCSSSATSGLGYLTLGQPSPTLSGGEAQRIKLARQLVKPAHGHTLYLLDEPTTGLHFADVQRLTDVLQQLVKNGHTVAVIEHNLEMILAADYIIDMGPEGGEGGGRVVAQGSPPELLACADRSHTARCLETYLAGRRAG